MLRTIGTTKLTSDGKITLVADVRKTMGVGGGDIIVFEENDKGEIVIRKG